MGLYNGLDAKGIHKKKGLKKSGLMDIFQAGGLIIN